MNMPFDIALIDRRMMIKTAVLLMSFIQLSAAQPDRYSGLGKNIETLLAGVRGTYAVAVIDLQTSDRLIINGEMLFHAASTMKTPVMVEVFRQAAEGKFSLDDSILVKNEFQSIIDGSSYSMDLSDDSDDGLYHRIGKKETIRSLVFKMITVSSNLATNILIGIVGAENIMATLHSLKITSVNVLRGVEDSKAFRAGKNNTTSALGLGLLFEQIARKNVVSPSACDEMIDILKAQQFKDMIPAQLPAGVVVAHKTGSITNVQHDSGIMYLPDGRSFVIVLLSKDLPNNKSGIETIATISKMIYDGVTR